MWISSTQTICKLVCVSCASVMCVCASVMITEADLYVYARTLVLLPCSLLTKSQYYNLFFFTSFGKESVLSHLFAFALECLQNRRAELLADLENHISKYVLLRWTSISKG